MCMHKNEYMTYFLGQIIGTELLKREFKELCLQNIDIYFTTSEIQQLIYNNKILDRICFNKMMLNIINQNIVKYMPKYIGNFSKAAISGEIIFGINDFGCVEGIPFYGELTTDIVSDMIMSAMSNSRGVQINLDGSISYDSDIVKWYYQNLQIQIIKLNSSEADTKYNYEQSIQLITQRRQKNKELQRIWSIYTSEQEKWHSLMTRYGGKLLKYLVDPELKQELIDYIIDTFDKNDTYDKSKLKDILKFFDQSDDVFRSMVFTLDIIEQILKDEYSPIKWLINYKDKCLKYIKKMKPLAPISPISDSMIYYQFMNNVKNIRSQLLMSSDINFYIIRITVPNMLNTYLEYRNKIFGVWLSKKRIDTDRGPSCI